MTCSGRIPSAPVSPHWTSWSRWSPAPRLLVAAALSYAPLLSLLVASCEAPEPVHERQRTEERNREATIGRDAFTLAEHGSPSTEPTSLSDQRLVDRQNLDQERVELPRERGGLDL